MVGNPSMGKCGNGISMITFIHNGEFYQNISNYIISNPANWEKDKFFRACQ